MEKQIKRGFLSIPLAVVLGFSSYEAFKDHMDKDGFFSKETPENQETEIRSIWDEAQSKQPETVPEKQQETAPAVTSTGSNPAAVSSTEQTGTKGGVVQPTKKGDTQADR